MKLIAGITISLLLTAFMSGCEANNPKITSKNIATELILCPEKRPQICTREYRPVCAQHKDGSFKTYSSECTACANPNVVGYRNDACEK